MLLPRDYGKDMEQSDWARFFLDRAQVSGLNVDKSFRLQPAQTGRCCLVRITLAGSRTLEARGEAPRMSLECPSQKFVGSGQSPQRDLWSATSREAHKSPAEYPSVPNLREVCGERTTRN